MIGKGCPASSRNRGLHSSRTVTGKVPEAGCVPFLMEEEKLREAFWPVKKLKSICQKMRGLKVLRLVLWCFSLLGTSCVSGLSFCRRSVLLMKERECCKCSLGTRLHDGTSISGKVFVGIVVFGSPF